MMKYIRLGSALAIFVGALAMPPIAQSEEICMIEQCSGGMCNQCFWTGPYCEAESPNCENCPVFTGCNQPE